MRSPGYRQAPLARVVTDQIPRFDARYWMVDGQRSTSLSLVSQGSSAFRVDGISRRKSDLVGVQWFSEDLRDHPDLRYETRRDYTGLTWTFRLRLSESLPPIEDERYGLTLTVETGDGPRYVRLANYTGGGTGRDVTVTLDFDALYGGFAPGEDSAARVPVGDIGALFFGVVPDGYDQASSDPLPAPVGWWLEVSEMGVGGNGAVLSRRRPVLPPHRLRMCTAYDDHYNLSPQRIVENCLALGYREWINHYCGMSHYMDVVWDPGEMRFRIDPQAPPSLNAPTAAWHRAFLARAQAAGFTVIQSVSYEIFSEVCPYEWAQRDWDGVLGTTGYTPPSYLVSPGILPGVDYLGGVMVRFAELADEAAMPVYIQIGEPWWWYQPDTRRPCVYDYPTKLAYFEETGFYAPDLGLIDVREDNQTPDAQRFIAWLRDKLDASNQRMRAAVKAAFPAAQVGPLFFLPTILDETSGIMAQINYPRDGYAAPNYDYIQTEAYDWTTAGLNDAAHAYRAYTIPTQELGYPQAQIHVLVGFAFESRARQWRYILQHARDGREAYPELNIYLWSYPQVMRDGLTE